MAKTTDRDRVRDLMRRTGRRSVEAARAAGVVSEQFDQMARALLDTNPHFETGLTALREVLRYMETVQAEVAAAAGHAVEGASLAADNAHELAQIATIAANLPELDQAGESRVSRYTLPAGYTPEMARKVIDNLAADVLLAAASGGVTFELAVRNDDDR